MVQFVDLQPTCLDQSILGNRNNNNNNNIKKPPQLTTSRRCNTVVILKKKKDFPITIFVYTREFIFYLTIHNIIIQFIMCNLYYKILLVN